MNQREALAAMVAGLVAAGAGGAGARGEAEESSSGMIYRILGKTGERVSAIGLGGFHIGMQSDP